MARLNEWTDRVDDVDDILADDVNSIAHGVLQHNDELDSVASSIDDINAEVSSVVAAQSDQAADITYIEGQLSRLDADKVNTSDIDSALSSSSTHPVQNKVVKTALDAKVNTSSVTGTISSGNNNPVKSGAVYSALQGKQNTLTFDNAPTSGSNNPVKSGGVYTALQNVSIDVDSEMSDSSTHPVQNKVIKSALDGKVGKESGYGLVSIENDDGDITLTKSENGTTENVYLYGQNVIEGAIDEVIGMMSDLKMPITITSGSTLEVTLNTNNSSYGKYTRSKALTSLTFSDGGWEGFGENIVIIFNSGKTPTEISYASNMTNTLIVWNGADCTTAGGVSRFTPQANKKYMLTITPMYYDVQVSVNRKYYFATVYEIPEVNSNVKPRTLETVTGAPPITLTGCDGTDSLVGLEIYGDCSQSGTPTIANPISVLAVGDYDSQTGKYIIPVTASIGGTTIGTFNISLDEPLRKITDYNNVVYQDYLDFKNSKVVRKVGKHVLSASETITGAGSNSSSASFNRYIITPSKNSPMASYATHKGNGYSNCFNAYNSGTVGTREEVVFGMNSSQIYVVIPPYYSSSIASNVYNYITNNGATDCIFYYPLATAEDETITGLPTITTAAGDVVLSIGRTLAPPTVTAEYYIEAEEED